MTLPAGLRLLLVDDEEDFVRTLAERLRLRDVSASVVFDGESALARLSEERFDLVVLDVGLPGVSGLQILQRIREERPGLPVVLLTGNVDAKDGLEGVKLGAAACLTKPLELREFLTLLTQLCTGERQ